MGVVWGRGGCLFYRIVIDGVLWVIKIEVHGLGESGMRKTRSQWLVGAI